jgi:hypothetical protein
MKDGQFKLFMDYKNNEMGLLKEKFSSLANCIAIIHTHYGNEMLHTWQSCKIHTTGACLQKHCKKWYVSF